MKYKNPMFVVTDIDKSVEFYQKVLGLPVIMDFGTNKTLTGDLTLQTSKTYEEFIGTNKEGNDFEIYFGENEFDNFVNRIFILNISTLSKNIHGDSK